MKMTWYKKPCRFILCMMLLAVAVFVAVGCSGTKTETPSTSAQVETSAAETVGEGEKVFFLEVVHADGTSRHFRVQTDEETVGAALAALGLIEGEEGPYGLFIKAVCGEAADFEKDGKYWAFYENGAYANAGVDVTAVVDGASYALRVEK